MENLLEVYVPTSVFRDRNLKVLEALVTYLKEQQGMRYSHIAKLLNRDPRTIWTVYRKAREKDARTRTTAK